MINTDKRYRKIYIIIALYFNVLRVDKRQANRKASRFLVIFYQFINYWALFIGKLLTETDKKRVQTKAAK